MLSNSALSIETEQRPPVLAAWMSPNSCGNTFSVVGRELVQEERTPVLWPTLPCLRGSRSIKLPVRTQGPGFGCRHRIRSSSHHGAYCVGQGDVNMEYYDGC